MNHSLTISCFKNYDRWNQARDFYMISKLTEVPVVNRRKTCITILSFLHRRDPDGLEVLSFSRRAMP